MGKKKRAVAQRPPRDIGAVAAAAALCAVLAGTALAVDTLAGAAFDAPKRLIALVGTALAAAAALAWPRRPPGESWRESPRLRRAALALAAGAFGLALVSALASPRRAPRTRHHACPGRPRPAAPPRGVARRARGPTGARGGVSGRLRRQRRGGGARGPRHLQPLSAGDRRRPAGHGSVRGQRRLPRHRPGAGLGSGARHTRHGAHDGAARSVGIRSRGVFRRPRRESEPDRPHGAARGRRGPPRPALPAARGAPAGGRRRRGGDRRPGLRDRCAAARRS